MTKFWLVTALFLTCACGNIPAPNSPSEPDTPASRTASGTATGKPSPATPVGDTVNPHKIPWSQVIPAPDGRSLDIVWWSGVEPCYALDHVTAVEDVDKVTVTVYEGHDRRSPDAACIEIMIQKTVRVDLKAPLGDRKVIDGAR